MFANLTERLNRTIRNLTGQGRLTEDNIKDSLREVRMALLEADVALSVVKPFIEQVREQAMGTEVIKSLTPGQVFIKIVHDQLIQLMGDACAELNLRTAPPAIILVAGLQGSGKTTSVAKLARWLKETQKKSVLVASADIYRPAAIQQLQTLATEVGVNFHPSQTHENPVDIARAAIAAARQQSIDVVLIDTAGRLHIDAEMMSEIQAIHQAIAPIETLFVVDSMTGQDAANTARAFNEALPLTGVILTKTDGDARGGAALSIRQITGKPIKFIGVGEKTTALEPFHPDRLASRILGMGDIVSLVEHAEQTLDREAVKHVAEKFKKGQAFDLEDYRLQIRQMGKLGGVNSLLDKLPGAGKIPNAAKEQINDKLFVQIEAMINSMTPQERRYPEIIRGSRKRRIAAGSGTDVQDINRLLKQFTQMQKMMKRFKGGGMMKMLKGIGGNLPF